MASGRNAAGIALGFAVFFGIAAVANVSVMGLVQDLDDADEIIGQCRAEVADLGRQVRRAVAARDLARSRERDAYRLMKVSHAQATQEAFARMRSDDSTAALRIETEKLKQSIAALKAIAIETGSVDTRVEPKRNRVKRKKKPAAKRQRAKVHEWWPW